MCQGINMYIQHCLGPNHKFRYPSPRDSQHSGYIQRSKILEILYTEPNQKHELNKPHKEFQKRIASNRSQNPRRDLERQIEAFSYPSLRSCSKFPS